MATAAQHLPTIGPMGVTLVEANNFISSHLDQPIEIFEKSIEVGVTTSMLSEITGYSTNEISGYFLASGKDTKELDNVRSLINYDLGSFAHFVDFDNDAGILSTASLQTIVKPTFDPLDYDAFFTPVWSSQVVDHALTSDELGVAHLGNVPHPGDVFEKNDNLESIFYGTLLNIFKALDQTELDQITNFTHTDTNEKEFQAMLVDTLSDSPSPSPWTDTELAGHVASYAVDIMNGYFDDYSIVGILDLSYLGKDFSHLL